MKIGVFCSANNNLAQSYFDCAINLGLWMGSNNIDLVYGGTDSGLMACIGKAVHEVGGRTIGVIPRIVEKGGRISEYVDVHIPCDDLTDRKAIMMLQSDAFIALPGGVGTLDEVMTVAASHSIGYHTKPVMLYDIDGFWQPCITMLDTMQSKGFIRGQWRDLILVVHSIDEIQQVLQSL